MAEIAERSGMQIVCSTGVQGYSIDEAGCPPPIVCEQWAWYQKTRRPWTTWR